MVSNSQVHYVDPASHAVLPHPFNRAAHESAVTTTTSAGNYHIPSNTPFVVYQKVFEDILGENPSLRCIAEKDWAWAHEAGIFLPQRNSIFVTSNRLVDGDESRIVISEVILPIDEAGSVKIVEHDESQHQIRMANGGTNYGKEGILFCDQGHGDQPSALVQVYLDRVGNLVSKPILNNFHGRSFNSLNDVVVHPNGTIWFTDPDYGYEQNFNPSPELPAQVYCFDPRNSDLRVVEQGIPKCNGILFSPDCKTCYITDTSFISGRGEKDPSKGGAIFAYDVVHHSGDISQPAMLANKRVFSFTDAGAPDGIKCDTQGNVYAGCFDGVHIWSPAGTLLGKIVLPDGDSCANLVFGPKGTLYIMAEQRLYEARLTAEGVLVKSR